jgi:hypothetical protein
MAANPNPLGAGPLVAPLVQGADRHAEVFGHLGDGEQSLRQRRVGAYQPTSRPRWDPLIAAATARVGPIDVVDQPTLTVQASVVLHRCVSPLGVL